GFIEPPPRPIPWPRPRDDRRFDRDREEDQPPSYQTNPSRQGIISASVELVSRIAIKCVYSPSHVLDVQRVSEPEPRSGFESRAGSTQQDFQLFYTLSDQDFGLSLLTHREPGKDGFFMLLVSLKAELDEKDVSAKEVIFVLDTSGSMSEQGKMEKAKSALRY